MSTSRQVLLSLCLWDDEDPGILDLSPGLCTEEVALCKFQETLPEKRWVSARATRDLWECKSTYEVWGNGPYEEVLSA